MTGRIIKGIAGFYYVYAEGRIYECKARGIFRREQLKPLVGDEVELDVTDETQAAGNITRILPRRSVLVRPAVANVDQALVIFAVAKPEPNLNLLDRFLIQMAQRHLQTVICFNKRDLDERGDGARFAEIYRGCGYPTVLVSALRQEGIGELQALLRGKTTTVAGPSGVGKSSLVNLLQSGTRMETGSISEKIERGKHTTRHAELLPAEADTYILDTPGFSSLDLFDLKKEELAGYYPEFAAAEPFCKFAGCAHISEPVCGVRDAVEEGRISRERYENYCQLYDELKAKRNYGK